MRKVLLFSFLFIFFVSPGFVLSQDGSRVGINLGISSWFNNCDVPAGGQNSGLEPAFGPNFTLNFGKFRVGGTFYFGKFDIGPEDGVQQTKDSNGNVTSVSFINDESKKRGFTSLGETKRIDFTLNAGYAFSRYATLSFSLVVNRHEVDLATYWFPTAANGIITNLPIDRNVPFSYTDTQYWLGQHFGGSIPVETISARFSIFYGLGLLVILGESGESKIGDNEFDSPRLTYTNEDGSIAGPGAARSLGTRPFGENVGVTVNVGAAFQLLNNVGLYGGYNLKFFSEDETDFIDNSKFHGPFFGINFTVK